MFATMHGKERVVAPLLERELGLRVVTVSGIDTDRFGTFSGEVERPGSQLDAARAKVRAAFDLNAHARFALASEGSFGPHPELPLVAMGREIVLLADRDGGLELIGHDASVDTNFSHAVVEDAAAASAFATRAGFPGHGVIVMAAAGDQPDPARALRKDIGDHQALDSAVREVLTLCGCAFLQTDMRAHRNPTRMAAIERATQDLVQRFRRRCPACEHPGFDVTERLPGLPCAQCGFPTRLPWREILRCAACGHDVARAASADGRADPRWCALCNP